MATVTTTGHPLVPTPEGVARWLATLLGDELGDLAPGQALADAGWDSLTLAEVVIAAEAELGAVLPDELVAALRTIDDVVHYLCVTAGRADGAAAAPVTLHPVTAADEPMLFGWWTAPERLVRFRLRGVTPSAEGFHRALWDGVLSQYIACDVDGVPVGLVTCFEPDLRNRFAHLAAITNPAVPSSALVPRALAVLVDRLFEQFDLRKLYAEVLDDNYGQVASGFGRLFRHEGRLRAHEYLDGRYADLHVLAVHRADWEAGRVHGHLARPLP